MSTYRISAAKMILTAVLSCSFLFAFTQSKMESYSAEVEARIKEVENNLGSWVELAGVPKWTLAERMKFYHCNGVSIAVIKDYKIQWARGFGFADSADVRPVTTSTLFLAGSNSKSLNAVGLLKLAQDGKVDLYTDINQYLKTWKFPYDSLSKGKKITIANLLSHTGGLTVHGFPGYETTDTIPTITEILNGERPANTPAIRSMYEPGLKSEYSGGGITISQLIVQDVTGQPYDVWMGEHVLKPLGMDLSSYTQPPPAARQSLLATGYYNDGKPVKGKYHIYPEMAAAGLWTNATDLAKYVIETELVLQGESAKVLDRKMTELRLTPYIDKEAAFGVFINNKDGVKYFTHGGVDEGFVSQYVGSFEGGNGVVVMTNTYNTSMFDEIINSVAKVYEWKNYYIPKVENEIKLPESVLKTYVGKYKIGDDTLSVLLQPGGLYMDVGSDHPWKMRFSDTTHWFVFEHNGAKNFLTDASGKVTGFTINDKTAQKLD